MTGEEPMPCIWIHPVEHLASSEICIWCGGLQVALYYFFSPTL